MRSTHRTLAVFFFLAVGLVYPNSVKFASAQNVQLGSDSERAAGKVLYNQKCAHCHGTTGDGNGPAKLFLRPEPRDFTASTFKFRTTASGELPSDDDIRRSIRLGMPYTAMPPWPGLSEKQVTNLVYYIKTFSTDFSGPFGEVEPLEMPDAPSITDETIARGRDIYVENQCFDCHGQRGLGNGKSAPTLADQWDQPIRAADLSKRWTFRGGGTREDIYRTFTTGLDGSPMPSFEVNPLEDRWALVDYVYSLSEDEPDYATVVTATFSLESVDLANPESAFDGVDDAYFPVVGQIIEPGRDFFPSVNGIEVAAVYDTDNVVFRLRWNDMRAETTGSNTPDMEVPAWPEDTDTTAAYSDAVALQFPSEMPSGTELPYFLFGDRKHPIDLWFADLAGTSANHYVGEGSGHLTTDGPSVSSSTRFDDGQWTVYLSRSRTEEGHISFDEGTFVPVSFSVWDGFARERGNRRGLTGWYHVYLDVAEKESPILPMIAYGLITLFIGLGITFVARRRYGRGDIDTA